MKASGGDGQAPTRWAISGGVAFWPAFSVLAVVVRGVRWDETFEWAQTLIGAVEYPGAHPFNRYIRTVFTVQHFISAALLWLTHSEVVVNGLRNVAYLALGVTPIFLLTTLLSRRAMIGHIAVVLALQHFLDPV